MDVLHFITLANYLFISPTLIPAQGRGGVFRGGTLGHVPPLAPSYPHPPPWMEKLVSGYCALKKSTKNFHGKCS